jgi:predicted GIY-YIG superfamily endonuclease
MRTTWKELEHLELQGECVYIIRDAEGNVAYVGHSRNIGKRLAEHAGGRSPVGKYIVSHYPSSSDWSIDILDGDASAERELIQLHEPPFNKLLRKGKAAASNLVLSPAADPTWLEKVSVEFVDAAIDDYIERVVVGHTLGLLLGTTLHRQRRQWFDQFYGEYSPREEWAKMFAILVSGGDEWSLVAGRIAYDSALEALQADIEKVRAFCRTVPMPEPDEFGQLPKRDQRRAVNARDVARQLGIWPSEFKENEDRGYARPLDEWKGFPMSQWRHDLGLSQPR